MINDRQYFSDIDPEVWNYEVGGYRVCGRWLTERIGRKLHSGDQKIFMMVIGAIKETIKLQQELEKLYSEVESSLVVLPQSNAQQTLGGAN